MNKAAYFSSFDPFHNGHLDIIKKASKLFDEVYVVIGFNKAKNRNYSYIDMKSMIDCIISENDLSNCQVNICHGLAIRYCEKHNINVLIRGLRNYTG